MRRRINSTASRPEPLQDIYHVGLVNLGNSCFYNTILQSLAVSHPLNDIIAHPPVTSPALLSLSPASPSYNPDPEALLSPMPITQSLLTLLKNLDVSGDVSRGKKVLNPKTLLRHLAAKHEEYSQATQQDAHEVLRHLIDGVMMEEVDLIKKVRAAAPKPARRPSMHSRTRTARPNGLENGMTPVAEEPPAEASAEEESSSVGGYETEEDSSESDDDSLSSSSSSSSDDEEPEELHDVDADGKLQTRMKPFIASVFDGKLASVVICDECKHVSATTEDFMDISLSLRDDAGNKLRKRDRIRKTLQSGFFSKKSSSDKASSNGSASSSNSHPRHQPISLSETEGSASASEYETDEEHPSADEGPHGHDPHFAGGRSRHNSLDPSKLGGAGGQRSGHWSSSNSRTRDHSPLGRAMSILSTTSGANSTASGSLASGMKRRRKKPKIPKPTAEQIAYIRRLLVEIPAAGPAPLPIRIARPPGQSAPSSSANSISSATSSMSSLQLGPDQTSTDLYECFRQFTSVEVLEGDNLFACHNCWKHMNPDIVEKRRIARDNKKRERLLRKVERGRTKRAKKQAEAAAMNEVTPSPSIAPDSPPAKETPLPSMHGAEELRVNGDRRASTISSINDAATSSPATFSSVSLHSEPSLLSSTDDGLADIEDGNVTDGCSIDSRGKLPLTTANVEALDDSVTPSASAAPSIAVSHSQVESASVSRLAASESVASLSTAFSTSSKPTPPKTARHILRRAHKRYLISAPDLPPVLVIHLKRFQQTNKSSLFGSSSFTNLKKRDDDLSFPPDLDLKPFLAPTEKPPRPAGAPPPRHHHRPSPSPMQSEYLVGEAKYSLYAVVVHFGTLVTGHYSAYVKSDRHGKGPGGSSERKWFFCSDEDVRACSLDEVLRSKAYILFYERVKPQPQVVSTSGVIAEEPAAADEGKGKL